MTKKVISASALAASLFLAVTPQAVAAAQHGNASCPSAVVGGVSAYSEQSVHNDFMYLSVGTSVKSGTGHWRMEVNTTNRSAFWYASSDSLRVAKGFCKPG